MERFKENTAITLLILVITIIILLILSSIIIFSLTGENSLIEKVKKSREKQTEAEMEEQLIIAINELKLQENGNVTLDNITQEWANNTLNKYSPILKNNEDNINSKIITMQIDGIIKQYKINFDLSIEKFENEKISLTYKIEKRTGNIAEILIKIASEDGIKEIYKPNSDIIYCIGKKNVGIDYKIEIGKEYKFKIISSTGEEKEEIIIIYPEIEVTEAYIGTNNNEMNSTNSVLDESQIQGTTLYINFNATLEGGQCTIEPALPYTIKCNGTYKFIVTGVFQDKTITKEIEVIVNKYEALGGFVQYDAGDWTKEEIEELEKSGLYNINIQKIEGDISGLNLTFGGFTYKEDESNQSYINNKAIITSRNQSVSSPNKNGGQYLTTPKYEGWQIAETKKQNGKLYITKLVHAGSPENFSFYSYRNGTNKAYMAEYILSSGLRKSGYTYNARKWDMYIDDKQKDLINTVHIMTYEEFFKISSNMKTTGGNYILATAKDHQNLMYVDYAGRYYDNLTMRCWGIRPIVDLKEGVCIVSGNGTQENPYVLGKD